MSPRLDEGFAQTGFAKFLNENELERSSWSAGADPPDFDLRVGDKCFPVEVAQLMESVAYEDDARTERGWTRVLESTAQRIEREMQRRGALHGCYAIHLEPALQTHRLADNLMDEIERFLGETAAARSAERRVLWKGKDGATWWIEKIGNSDNMLAPTMSIGGAKRRPEIHEDLRMMLESELADKRHKTRALPDTIVLFVDAYHYADHQDWNRIAASVDFSPFHTVARIHGEWRCQILFSRNARWQAESQ